MEYRFYKDVDTGLSHCRQHGITEPEVISVLQSTRRRLRNNQDGTMVAEGQTDAGRYLRVIYRHLADQDYIFVITAYDLTNKAKRALRRRRKNDI